MVKLNIIGAFDRFNYGDVLFPHIIKEKLVHLNSQYEFQYVSTAPIDLTNKGGFKTVAMRDMFKNSSPNSVYLVSGGEVLAAPWWYMLLCLVKNEEAALKQDELLKDGVTVANGIARKEFKCQHFYPWVIERRDLSKRDDLIIYNAVGGTSLRKLDKDTNKKIGRELKHVDYISVRDQESRNTLLELLDQKPDHIKVYPDCGILISDIFKEDLVTKNTTNETKLLVTNTKKYIAFQAGKYHVLNQASTDIIVEQLISIVENEDIDIILTPFSDASFHEDNLILKEIHNKTNHNRIHYSAAIDLFSITHIIMNAQLFMGTSLHGNIVSFSYGTPSIGLTFIDSKLPTFIETWIKPNHKACFEFNELQLAFDHFKELNKESYLLKSKDAIAKGQENIDNISSLISNHKPSYNWFQKIFQKK